MLQVFRKRWSNHMDLILCFLCIMFRCIALKNLKLLLELTRSYCVSKIEHIIQYSTYGAVCFQFTQFPCDGWENILICLTIIIKSEVWTIIIHCLGLGDETMVCAVCLFIFFLLKDLTCGFRKAEHESCYFGGWARTAMPIQAFSVVEVGGILLWEI